MIADVPYYQYNLTVEYYNQFEQQEEKSITRSLKYIKNKGLYLDENNEIIKDPNFYLYLILDTMLDLKLDYYLTNPTIEYNDRDFGSHAKLAGFANTFIKKLSKKLENSLFKIKNRELRIYILEYLANIFTDHLAEFRDLSDLYIEFHSNKGDYNYQLLISDKLETTKKIKKCYNQIFPIITNLLHNCISIEKLLSSFETANSQFGDIWKLFIDGENQHKGRLFFENEQGYLLNSLRGLAFALNEINQHKNIDYNFLVKISEVIGCNKREDISSSIYLSFRYSPEVLTELFKKSYYKGSRRGTMTMINLLNINLDEISCHYNKAEKYKDPNRIYLLEIFNSSLYPYMLVYYLGEKTKRQYINELFIDYYKAINNISTPSLEQVLQVSLVLCRELQYLHPLSDGTGRAFLFILLPLLLYQQGFWINSTPEYVWDLLSVSMDQLIKKTLPLCSAARQINSKIDWQTNMKTIDKIYIYCIMGDLTKLKEIIQNDYQLLETTIPIVNISPLEVAVLNNNVELIKYLLMHASKKNLHRKIDKILDYLRDINPSLKKLIGKYYLQMLDETIEEKEKFLFD
jgi:hypothetical protein